MFQLGVQLCSSPSVRVRGVDGPDGSSRPLPVVHVKQRNHCLILVWHAVQGKTIILTKYLQPFASTIFSCFSGYVLAMGVVRLQPDHPGQRSDGADWDPDWPPLLFPDVQVPARLWRSQPPKDTANLLRLVP